MNQAEVEKLLEKYRCGNCTEAEKAWIESWHLKDLAARKSNVSEEEISTASKKMWSAIQFQAGLSVKRRHTLGFKIAAAAVILLCIGFAIHFSHPSVTDTLPRIAAIPPKNIQPGGNKATLTLADGSKISLNDAANGVIAKEAGIKITKTKKGELIYTIAASATNPENLYNSIETPRGGQYQLNLPDGTKVWLNAASSLRYPAAFGNQERVVELKGEAYFEVAKRLDHHGQRLSFKVLTHPGSGRNQEVEVLGTHFNINAYADEAVNRTTLLEGSVKVRNLQSGQSGILRPGQQSTISAASPAIKINQVDAAESIAWKDGFFNFDDERLETIMNKIARWYDVEIDYRGNKIDKVFGGRISRFNSVNEVLDLLQITGAVHFKIEGRRIIVMP